MLLFFQCCRVELKFPKLNTWAVHLRINTGIKKNVFDWTLSVYSGFYSFSKVLTPLKKEIFFYHFSSAFSEILFTVCVRVCVFCVEALMCFQKALIPDSNLLNVFHAFHHHNYWMYINCCLPGPTWIVWINDYHKVLVEFLSIIICVLVVHLHPFLTAAISINICSVCWGFFFFFSVGGRVSQYITCYWHWS